jgi:ketosteroid isomerase-like protein
LDARDVRFKIEELVERDDRGAALGNMRAIGTGSGLDVGTPVAFVYTFHFGRIVRAAEYLDWARAREAAGWL